MNLGRRTFLVTGALGAAALAAGGWLRQRATHAPAGGAVDAGARTILAALVPAFLDGALPLDAQRADAVRETLDAIERAIAGLPPAAQAELAQLFGLLAFAPARIAMTGLWSDWRNATTADVQSVLARWQTSRTALLRSAYDALHQLVLAAWYANPRTWPAIGYPGPPPLE